MGNLPAVFGGALVLALLAGLLIGPGGGLAIIAIGLIGTVIMLARHEQATVAGQTSAIFQSAGAARPDPVRPDSGREDDQSRPSV